MVTNLGPWRGLFLDGVKLTDRYWDGTHDLASISTVFGPIELKIDDSFPFSLKTPPLIEGGFLH